MKSLDHFKEEFAEEHVCVVREEGRRLPTIVRSLPHSVLSVGPYDHTAKLLTVCEKYKPYENKTRNISLVYS